MYFASDPNLRRLFKVIEHDREWALLDPDFPVLPRLRPRMVHVLEYLAGEFLNEPEPEHIGHGEIYDPQFVALDSLGDLLQTLFTGREVHEDVDGAMFPYEGGVERLRKAVEGGIFEDEHAWTKSHEELAVTMVLQIVRRAMELKSGRWAVVSRFDRTT